MDNTSFPSQTNTQSWGIDESPENRPGIPRERTPARNGAHWERPEQQIPKVKIHQTVERNRLTATFGTVAPPKGLSGKIRDFAYLYSENTLRHWMMLLFADRVDVVENLLIDIAHGKLPLVLKEMGLASEFHNRQGLGRLFDSRKVGGKPTRGLLMLGGVAATGLAFYLWKRTSENANSPLGGIEANRFETT